MNCIGGKGDDTLVLGHGDWGTGGPGHDEFRVMLEDGDPAEISDFDETEDSLVIDFDENEVGPDPALDAYYDADLNATVVTLQSEEVVILRGVNGIDLTKVEPRANSTKCLVGINTANAGAENCIFSARALFKDQGAAPLKFLIFELSACNN